jgi:hypothetical protein
MLKSGFSFKAEAKWILLLSLALPVVGLIVYFIRLLIR